MSLFEEQEAAERAERERATAAVVAVADIYVLTNRLRDLLEERLDAIERAVDAGASHDDLQRALDGADHPTLR